MKTELNSWRRFIHSQIEKPVEYLDTHTYMKGRWDRCIDHLYNIKLSLKVVFAHQHHFCHLFPRSQTYYFKSRQIDVSISYARYPTWFLGRRFIDTKINKNNFLFLDFAISFLALSWSHKVNILCLVSKSTLINFRF